jgi:UDP-glucose 4-epimerase
MDVSDATRADPAPIRDQTVLVTGGAGFVGSHLSDALVEHNELRVIDDLTNGRPENVPDGATFIEGDIRDDDALAEAMDGVDIVFHQAGLVSVPASVEDPQESQDRNAVATLSILERARETDARVVLASSVAIYGDPEELPVREDDPKRPDSPYGVDKLAIDHYARLYHEHYGLDTVALRYFNVYGPRQSGGSYSGVIGTFVGQAQSDQPITVHGDGQQTRDFVHVSDVVRANLAAAETDAVGRGFNIGTGESVTIRELADEIRSITGADSEIVHADPRDGDVDRSRADISAARQHLGFDPQVSLHDGLRDLVGVAEVEQ